jgi:hypothetical protein
MFSTLLELEIKVSERVLSLQDNTAYRPETLTPRTAFDSVTTACAKVGLMYNFITIKTLVCGRA